MPSRMDDDLSRYRSWTALPRRLLRYGVAVAIVALAFGIKKLVQPATGTGAPFALFFGAVLVTSVWAGPGPGVCATLLALAVAAFGFLVPAGFSASQAAAQAALFAVDGVIVVYLSFIVTRARRVAETSEQRLRMANEAASIASWEHDLVADRIRWSPEAQLLFGRAERKVACFADLLALIHPDDRDAFQRAYAWSFDPGRDRTMSCEVRVVRPDGSVRWLSCAGRSDRGDRGRAAARVWQVGTAIDVTERRQREEELKELTKELSFAEARRRELIELAPEAFFLADLTGQFRDVNQAACRMLGYERSELLGKTVVDLLPPDEVPRLAAVFAELLVPGQVHVAEWKHRRKDGTLIPVEVSSNVLPGGRWQAFVRDISERRRVEDERQVLVSFLENSSDFIGIADPSGKPIYLNPAGRQMVGLPADYPLHETQIPEYYPPEERAFVSTVILRSTVEHGRWSGETCLRHWQTQRAIPVSDEHFMIFDPSCERLLGMGTITRDISDARRMAREREELLTREQLARQQAEKATAELRGSEERFRLIIDEAPIGMALVSLDGLFVRVNPALSELVGYSIEELQSMRFYDITHADDLDSDVDLSGRLFRGEIPRYQLEKRYVRKDGRIVWILLSASILRGDDGKPLYGIAQMQDIAERKRGEDEQRFLAEAGALLASSLDYEQTLSTLGQLMVRDFADWCIVDIIENDNRLVRVKVVGAQDSQAPLAARFEQLQLDRHQPHLARVVLEQRQPYVIERVTPENLQSFAQSEEHLQILRGMDVQSIMGLPLAVRGELLGVMILISSNPGRRYKAGDLRFAGALAERAALAIENGRLYRTAVRATQLRDEVLGVVAHDLRNPLATITMQASAFRRRGQESDRRNQKPIESILRAASRMNRLIGDLLDVTSMEAGQLAIDRGRVPTRQLLAESVDGQRPLASSKLLEMDLDLPEDLPDVWGDYHRLLEVLENLIGNAVKFTPAEGRITVGAATREAEVLFRVADTGSGISPDSLPHVFDRFWQANKAARQGAGLGLPITRGIIEAHGGHIWVESTVGRGTVFFFTVPAAPGTEARPPEMTH